MQLSVHILEQKEGVTNRAYGLGDTHSGEGLVLSNALFHHLHLSETVSLFR